MVPNQVILDPSAKDGSWAVYFEGRIVATGYNSKGAARAALALYISGYRTAEKKIENPVEFS